MGKEKSQRKFSHSGIVERNIRILLDRRKEEEEKKKWQDKIGDKITAFSGTMYFVFLHLLLFSLWIIINLGWTPIPEFDPSFVVLAMFASVEAIFLSTFVLISQNRMAKLADKRADLDLQVSLLAEHEITRLVTLSKQIAKRLEIREADNPTLRELEKDVNPERVLDVIEKKEGEVFKAKKKKKKKRFKRKPFIQNNEPITE